MFVTSQRNLTSSINNSNTKQQRFTITENNKIKVNKFDEYYKKQNSFNN